MDTKSILLDIKKGIQECYNSLGDELHVYGYDDFERDAYKKCMDDFRILMHEEIETQIYLLERNKK